MTTIDSAEAFGIGRVVTRTFDVLWRNIGVFLILAALMMVPVLLATYYFTFDPSFAGLAPGKTPPGQTGLLMEKIFLPMLVLIVCTYVLQAALVQGTITYLNGEKPGLGVCLATGFKAFVPVTVIAILSLLGMTLGFLLLIVPGIIIALAWTVVIPVRIVEHTGIGASFGRSRALTAGYRWKIFLLLLMYSIVAILIELVTLPLLGFSVFHPDAAAAGLPVLIVSWIERVVLSALTAVGVASVYYELRLVKEGVGPQQLAAAFD